MSETESLDLSSNKNAASNDLAAASSSTSSRTNSTRGESREPRIEVMRKGKSIKGVYPLSKQLAENDWILVNFSNSVRASAKDNLYIGSVLDIEEALKVNFVKYVPTKLSRGQVFQWPDKDDISEIALGQIVRSVDDPKINRRGQPRSVVIWL